jgi:hypothetical protein
MTNPVTQTNYGAELLERDFASEERLSVNTRAIRDLLGINPVEKLSKIRGALIGIGASENSREGMLSIIYPYHLTEVARASVWEVDRLYFVPEASGDGSYAPIMFLYCAIDAYAQALHCHPAIALAFLLADVQLPREEFIAIIEKTRMEIIINHPEVSPESVRKLYSLVRNAMIREFREVKGKWARPRPATKRMIALGKFVVGNNQLSLEELLQKWNAAHPEWEYKNVNSMAAAYSRLKGRMRRGVGLVRYWFTNHSNP